MTTYVVLPKGSRMQPHTDLDTKSGGSGAEEPHFPREAIPRKAPTPQPSKVLFCVTAREPGRATAGPYAPLG
jgi:hypothetical protein